MILYDGPFKYLVLHNLYWGYPKVDGEIIKKKNNIWDVTEFQNSVLGLGEFLIQKCILKYVRKKFISVRGRSKCEWYLYSHNDSSVVCFPETVLSDIDLGWDTREFFLPHAYHEIRCMYFTCIYYNVVSVGFMKTKLIQLQSWMIIIA